MSLLRCGVVLVSAPVWGGAGALLRCGVVLVLWVTAQCGAASGQPPADLADLSAGVCGSLDPLWTAAGRIVKSAVEPPIAELASKLDGVQTGLNSVQTRLNSVQSELESGLNSVQTRLNSVQSELESGLNSVQTRLNSVQSELESGLKSVQCELLPPARDCSDLPAGATSGVHLLQPGLRRPVPAYCDLDTDGGNWTVIQRRADIQPRQDFFLGWEAYKWGLGELDAEFWWGLEHLWLTTSLLDRRYQLRIDMEDFDGGKRYALYQGFRVSSEADGYRLTVANFTGDAKDSFGGLTSMRFSTKDRDQDTHTGSCSQKFKGGWWYSDCHSSNLNGLYLSGDHSSYADGINWYTWRGHHYSLKAAEMKIRPSKKL